jgi:eukaryotic-like serine/threonine-protein kinase
VRVTLPALIYRPILGALVVALLVAIPASAQVQHSWPMVGGDPSHSGSVAGPPAPYRRIWSTKIGDGGIAGPVVQEGTVVALAGDKVVALSVDDGAVLWEMTREPGPAGPAAIEGDVVVFAEGTGREGAVVAVGFEDGQEHWRVETRSPVAGGVTVSDGVGFFGARDGTVRAIDLESGDERWTFDASGRVETAPAVGDGLVVVVAESFKTGRATAYALQESTGDEEWSFSPNGVALGASPVAVGNGLAVFGLGDLNVHAIELDSGRERWSTRSRAPFSARMVPALPDDGFIADRGGNLYRLDGSSGEEGWLFRVPGSLLTGSPVVGSTSVIVGDRSGQVSAIDIQSGHLVWKDTKSEGSIQGIAASTDGLFVTSGDGSVTAFEHDPQGALLDEASPTTLFVGRAVLNFVAAFIALMALLFLLFRWVGRRPERKFSEDWAAGDRT